MPSAREIYTHMHLSERHYFRLLKELRKADIRPQPQVEPKADVDSSVQNFADWLKADLTLTPTEFRVVDVFGSRFGAWIPAQALVRAVYRDTFQRDLLECDINTIRTHIWRIRRKLQRTPWRIENRYSHGLYRLVRSA